MNNLVISLIVLYAAAYSEATLFSWSSSEAKESKPTGYLPILQVHKYNGFQINPIQGPAVYLPNEPNELNNLEGQTTQLNAEQIQQLDMINRLATFLPADADLQEMDLSDVLPYVNLVSEDSLEKFKHVVESSKKKEKSKILKIIAFLKGIKAKKLKPFKYVASVGSNIIHKKKNWIFGSGSTTTTPEPYTETLPSVTYPVTSAPYGIACNPYVTQCKPNFNSYQGAALEPRLPVPLSSYPYYQQYPIYSYNQQQRNPSENSVIQFPTTYVSNTPQNQPIESAAETQNLPKLPSNIPTPFAQFPNHFQYPSNFPYLSLPASSTAEPAAKNEITYEYKQPPVSTFAVQDTTNNANRQIVTFNQSELPSTPAPKTEPSNQQQYSYHISPASTYKAPQQPSLALPAYQSNSWYFPSSYQNTNQEPNKFYTSSPNDLAAAGSENIEKIAQQAKPASSQIDETESFKLNNAATSTETTVSKSQQSGPKRTHLRPVQAPARTTVVYPSLPKDETSKDDSNKSSPENTSTTN